MQTMYIVWNFIHHDEKFYRKNDVSFNYYMGFGSSQSQSLAGNVIQHANRKCEVHLMHLCLFYSVLHDEMQNFTQWQGTCIIQRRSSIDILIMQHKALKIIVHVIFDIDLFVRIIQTQLLQDLQNEPYSCSYIIKMIKRFL